MLYKSICWPLKRWTVVGAAFQASIIKALTVHLGPLEFEEADLVSSFKIGHVCDMKLVSGGL